MPATMARKRTRAAGRPPARRSGKPLQVYLSAEMRAALDAYVEATRPKPTITTVVEMALEDLLRKSGHLPPARPDEPS